MTSNTLFKTRFFKRCLLILLLMNIGITANATELVRNSLVPNAKDYPRGVAVSKHYRVMVKKLSDTSPWSAENNTTATYKLWPDYLDPETLPAKHKNTAVHVAQFDADEPVKIRVELLTEQTIKRLQVKPSRYQEMSASRKQGANWVEFVVNPAKLTKHILVEINGPESDTDALQDGLMIFANPIAVVPKGNVLVLPAGVINEKSPVMDKLNRILIEQDSPYTGMFIPQNTIVDGRLDIRKKDFVVAGRGMIAGSRWTFAKSEPGWRKSYPKWISPDGQEMKPLVSYKALGSGNEGGKFEGILAVHPYHFCFGGAAENENVKAFGWRFSSDGVHGFAKRGVFVRVNDDANYVADGIIEDSSYWGMANGAIFQFGWGTKGADNNKLAEVHRANVLRGEWDNVDDPGLHSLGAPANAVPATSENLSANRGVFVGTYRDTSAPARVSNKHFNDIRVDGQVNRLFYLGSRSGLVSYANITFKNIWFEKKPSYAEVKNVLSGESLIDEILFSNFVVAERKIQKLTDFEPIELKNVKKVEFN